MRDLEGKKNKSNKLRSFHDDAEILDAGGRWERAEICRRLRCGTEKADATVTRSGAGPSRVQRASDARWRPGIVPSAPAIISTSSVFPPWLLLTTRNFATCSTVMENVAATQSAFQRVRAAPIVICALSVHGFPLQLKVSCVPLLANSLLTPNNIPSVIKLLSDLHDTISNLQAGGYVFPPATISYVFFPLSSLLRRNDLPSIPDRILEQLIRVLGSICEPWWWDMDVAAWEQVFMLCSAILGGIDRKGKGKDRDEETKVAAAQCLFGLLRERTPSTLR